MIDYDQLTDLAGIDALSGFFYVNIPGWPRMLPCEDYLGVEFNTWQLPAEIALCHSKWLEEMPQNLRAWYETNRIWMPQLKSNNPNGYIL